MTISQINKYNKAILKQLKKSKKTVSYRYDKKSKSSLFTYRAKYQKKNRNLLVSFEKNKVFMIEI